MAGSPRFYYQNDFFGSGSAEFNYRLQQLYGSIYNVTVGQTFSPFEDPDIWPDTVDYEGPNSMIFARFPLVRYKLDLAEGWNANGGLTESNTQVSDFDGEPVSGVDHAPDFAFNLRGESADLGHIQFSTVFRDLGAKDPTFGTNSVFGWGLNLAGEVSSRCRGNRGRRFARGTAHLRRGHRPLRQRLELLRRPTPRTTARVTSRHCPTSAARRLHAPLAARLALDGHLRLRAGQRIPSQGPNAYHQTNYASLNLIWQMRERLSVGVEGLYGDNQKESGHSGSDFRTQVGVAYSLF